MSVKWVFDPVPPSGKRTGGNAAEYSFEGKIDTLVREVVQNSLDASLKDGETVRVRFRLVELSGDELERFLEGLSWDSLADNLEAVPEKRGGRAIRTAIEAMTETDSLRLLIIEDRGTKGLEGNEIRENDDDPNSFCALVRDELYSDKDDPNAGGSFGLGKSVLWAYSSLKTVLFASIPHNPPARHSGLRLIGRASLPYHETDDDGACSGDGWLGSAQSTQGHDRRAESVWGTRATRVVEACLCDRADSDFGLSTVIVGFSEPGEEDRALDGVMQTIVEASLESFWPAIVRNQLSIEVTRELNRDVVETHAVDPSASAAYAPVVELLRSFDSGQLEERKKLEIGESAVRWVPIELPARTVEPAHTETEGQVAVLVRLLEDDARFEPIKDRIFRFRQRGMVVRSGGGSNLSIAARPYVAAVVAGRACGDDTPSDRVEMFLRAAEPPAHDTWRHDTRALKQDYKSFGCGTKLKRFEQRLLDAIRELVSVPEEKGGALPKSLLKHLRFGDFGGGGKPRFLSVTHTDAEVNDGAWTFHTRCRRVAPGADPWHVVVHLKYAVDGGHGEDVHAIGEVTAKGSTRAEVREGVAYIEFPPDVTSARIEGRTTTGALPAIGTRAAVQLRIDGGSGRIPDA